MKKCVSYTEKTVWLVQQKFVVVPTKYWWFQFCWINKTRLIGFVIRTKILLRQQQIFCWPNQTVFSM